MGLRRYYSLSNLVRRLYSNKEYQSVIDWSVSAGSVELTWLIRLVFSYGSLFILLVICEINSLSILDCILLISLDFDSFDRCLYQKKKKKKKKKRSYSIFMQ